MFWNWNTTDWVGLAVTVGLWATAAWALWYFGKAEGASGWQAFLKGVLVVRFWVEDRLQEWAYNVRIRRLTEVEALTEIRKGFAELGVSLDHLTDDDIRDGCLRSAELVAMTGLTVAEASEALDAVGRAMQEA